MLPLVLLLAELTLARPAGASELLAVLRTRWRALALRLVPFLVVAVAGTLVTIAGFVPVGFAASSAGEYTFSLFAVVAIALVVSWFVAVLFAPLLGVSTVPPNNS